MDFKEQMAEARRTQILMGAAQVFAQKGFHKATTKEIAQSAGVSEGTIYNYFDNKRELLLAMVEMIGTQSFKTVVLDHPPDDPREFLTMILRDRFQLVQEHGHILAALIAEIFSDASLRELVYNQIIKPIAALIENYLQHQIDRGKFRRINPVIVTRALIGTMVLNTAIKFTAIDSRYQEFSAEAMIEDIVSLFMDGLVISDLPLDN
jgi:AcrR family transcriptional regulator